MNCLEGINYENVECKAILFDIVNDIIFVRLLGIISLTGRKEMFYLTTHSSHFIEVYMASNIWSTV